MNNDTLRPTIKIGFTDYFAGLDDFFIHTLSRRYNVVRDDVKPDYLFFCDETFGQNNLMFQDPNTVRIFYTGENKRPYGRQTDFAISFDHLSQSNHFRLPLYVIDYWMMVHYHGMPRIELTYRLAEEAKSKTKFAAFISGNDACPQRNKFFEVLSQYKKVDAAGPLFNNIGEVLPRGMEAAKNKAEFLKPYKFNLCFENSSYPGYCTEKLFHALYMKTIPIYWGSPTVALDFNPAAFIHFSDDCDFPAMIEKVIELDNDPVAYEKMYLQPMIHTLNGSAFDLQRFVDWFSRNVYKFKE